MRTRLHLAVVLSVFALTGCGTTTSPVPVASLDASATPEATVSLTSQPPATTAPSSEPSLPARPSPSSTPPPAWVDPASGYSIAVPYTLDRFSTQTQAIFQTEWQPRLGTFGGLISVGERAVNDAGNAAGLIVVMTFPPGTPTNEIYAGALAAMGVAGAASEPMTVDGIPVSTFTMPAAGPSDTVTGAVFRHGDSVVWVLPMDNSMLIPITTALITANH